MGAARGSRSTCHPAGRRAHARFAPTADAQIVHGDTAGPNVLFQHDDVAAFVDFRPPAPGYLAWEIARLGCDPKSVLDNSAQSWITGFTYLTLAYRDANPKASTADLLSSLRVGCTPCSARPSH
ncbi:phosphotransferase [Streptomyces sp. NPDC127036]|uniref:phosphotransferase n=1 Tax=Streptomyces sp. NPDC127036 TaxID=3347112 RepID=UPI00365B25CC